MPDNQVLSVLNLERLFFEEITYSRELEDAGKNIEYEMNFNRAISVNDDSKHYKVSLTANVRSKEKQSIQLKVTLTGIFYCDYADEKIKQELVQYNTIAIMFPYIRSQISLISTQPDIPPITIPPVNIVALFKDVDQREANTQQE